MNSKRLKILVVDDEPDLVTSLSRVLELRGFEVKAARDGKEAIAKNLEWEPDAVIMDVRMPRLNGIAAYLEMQRTRPGVLVILMTGFSDALDEANESIFEAAARNGRVEVMMKPLDLDRVMALLTSGDSWPLPAEE
jgi:DNA-binding NtrC family response regulator